MDMSFKCVLTNEHASLPKKNNESDAGYDLTLTNVHKQMGAVTMYGTGVKVKAPKDYYFDLVPRSSIIKTGYMLANSVGVIDTDYIGEIYVPLIKIDETASELELPIRLVQLIPRKCHKLNVEEVESLETTIRAENGFGSSGN